MSVKAAKLRATLKNTLRLFLVTFGVCSVSVEAYSYPLSRETPKAQKAVESQPPKSPFAPGTNNLSLGVGQVFLFGALGNSYDNAIGPELHYSYGVSDLFAFEANFGYHSHSKSSSSSLSIWNLNAGLRSNLMYFDQLVPYVNVGLGFYHPSFSYVGGGSASTTLFGLQLGTGIDLLITNNLFFGAALTYNDMFDSTKKDSNGVDQSMGGAYLSFMVHAGVTF